MKNRILNFNQTKDQTLRDLINNLRLNSMADIPVSKLIMKYKPNTIEELTDILDRCGKYTLKKRSEILYNECELYSTDLDFKNYKVIEEDCYDMIFKVLISDSWYGFNMERRAIHYLKEQFTKNKLPLKINQSETLDIDNAIDIEITLYDRVVIGIQVKPIYYKYNLSENIAKHKLQEERKHKAYKEKTDAHVIYLYYTKKEDSFDNMNDIGRAISYQLKKRF